MVSPATVRGFIVLLATHASIDLEFKDIAKRLTPRVVKRESVFGRVVVISFLIITTSIWLPIIVGALALSLIGHLWSRFRTRPRVDSANRHRSCSAPGGADRRG